MREEFNTNFLTEEPIVQMSTNMEPCTKRLSDIRREKGDSDCGLRRNSAFSGEDIIPLLLHEQANAVLRNLPDGVHLILRKDGIAPSLGSLYRLVNDFFLGGRATITFVLTHFSTYTHHHRSGWLSSVQEK